MPIPKIMAETKPTLNATTALLAPAFSVLSLSANIAGKIALMMCGKPAAQKFSFQLLINAQIGK